MELPSEAVSLLEMGDKLVANGRFKSIKEVMTWVEMCEKVIPKLAPELAAKADEPKTELKVVKE